MALAIDRDGPLLHRLEQRGLGLGGRAIDLVGEHEIGEDRSLAKAELTRARQQRDPRDVGRHQVRRELNAHESHTQRERERAHEQCLGGPRHALEEDVSTREQAEEHFTRCGVLTQHDAAQRV